MDYGYYQQDEAYGTQGLETTVYSQAYLKGSQPQTGTTGAVAAEKTDKLHNEGSVTGKMLQPAPPTLSILLS